MDSDLVLNELLKLRLLLEIKPERSILAVIKLRNERLNLCFCQICRSKEIHVVGFDIHPMVLSCLYVQRGQASEHNAFAFLFANLLQKLVKCRVRVRKRSHHNSTMEHKRTKGSSFSGGSKPA
jgi:hypothetical protein